MPVDILIAKLSGVGLFPIRVEANVLDKDSGGRVFIGNLDEFIRAVKRLDVNVVFVSSRALEKEDFTYDVTEADNGDDTGGGVDEEPIHLASVMPALGKFEQYIGQDCAYKLSVPIIDDTLDFYSQEPWWLEFSDLFAEAVAKVKQDKQAARELKRVERKAKQD